MCAIFAGSWRWRWLGWADLSGMLAEVAKAGYALMDTYAGRYSG